MSHIQSEAPSTRRLLKATAVAMAVAAIILVTTVLPAEYGIDPTGIGARLGLDVLGGSAQAAEIKAPTVATRPQDATPDNAANVAEAVKAADAFGVAPGQAFDTQAVSRSAGAFRSDTLSVTLEPGKGAEVKARLKAGDRLVFHWVADNDVALDMHGEREGAKDAWTSYWVEPAQRAGSGTFVAPFDGSHGWYWQNRGTSPVTVQINVTGFQKELYRPGKS
ncbi:MAG: hypothetical protein ABIO75_00490 [Thermomonas sp.]